VVQLGGLITVVLLGGFMAIMFRRDYRYGRDWSKSPPETAKKVNG
jgi:hypothetical protein